MEQWRAADEMIEQHRHHLEEMLAARTQDLLRSNAALSQARDAAERSDAIIAVSEFTRRQVVELLGVAPARVRVVHHGVPALAYPRVARAE